MHLGNIRGLSNTSFQTQISNIGPPLNRVTQCTNPNHFLTKGCKDRKSTIRIKLSHTNEDWCELWEPEMQCYCDIFRSSKHQQFVQFSEQTRRLQHSVKQPDILLQVYFIQSKASLSTPPGHWNWATEEKVFKVVQNISFLFALT